MTLIVAQFLLKRKKPISLSSLISKIDKISRGNIIASVLGLFEMDCVSINWDNNTISPKKRNLNRYIKSHLEH